MSATRRTGRPRAADPGADCRTWVEAAAGGRLPRLLLISPPARGEEEVWFAEQVLGAARNAARAEDGLELLDLDGGSPDFAAEALEGFLAASSLFGGARVLVFGRAGCALARRPELAARLGAAAGDPAGPRWMVVHACGGGKALGRTGAAGKALAAVAKREGVEKLSFRRLYGDPPPWNPDPDASEAARFVAEEGRQRGLQLGPGAPGLLVQLAGPRPAELIQAVEHFLLLGLTAVDAGRVRDVAAHTAEGNAFAFADAVLAGQAGEALGLLQKLDSRGLRTWDGRRLPMRDAFSLLLAVLAGERRKCAAVQGALDRGEDFSAACKAAGVPAGGPPAQRMRRRLEECGPERLDRVLAGLRRAERRVKVEGWREAGRALEELAVHAHRPRKAP